MKKTVIVFFTALFFYAVGQTKINSIQLGSDMNEVENTQVAEQLKKLLADTYILYVKTQGYHWNVKGPFFDPLHKMFQGQYEQLAKNVDRVAERIQALGVTSPSSMKQFLDFGSLKEDPTAPAAPQMLKNLLHDYQSIINSIRGYIKQAQQAEDEATINMLADLLEGYEKTAWMLSSSIQ